MQGAPLLGVAFSIGALTADKTAALAVFAAASVLLVAHIFVVNDWAGMSADLNDPNKAASVFVTRGIRRNDVGYLAMALLTASLVLFGLLSPRMLVIASVIAVLGFLYSFPAFHAKGVPLLSSAAHLVGGLLHFLLGYALFAPIDARGIQIALFFALTVTAGHLNQEARDYDGDRLNGIRTNAVAFGRTRTFVAGFVLFTVSYGYLVLLAVRGVIPRPLMLTGILYPAHLYWSFKTWRAGLTFRSISLLRARYRLLFAIIGVSMLAALLAGTVTPPARLRTLRSSAARRPIPARRASHLSRGTRRGFSA